MAADGYTILHSGRPAPTGDVVTRRKGVGIILDKRVTAAYRTAGDSRRIIMM